MWPAVTGATPAEIATGSRLNLTSAYLPSVKKACLLLFKLRCLHQSAPHSWTNFSTVLMSALACFAQLSLSRYRPRILHLHPVLLLPPSTMVSACDDSLALQAPRFLEHSARGVGTRVRVRHARQLRR